MGASATMFDDLDEKSVRDEITRQFDVCNGCRRCTAYCTTFPTLFEMLDQRPGSDAGRMTPAQQDHVVEECFQCGRCVAACPYRPGLDPLTIDVPRLVARAVAMQRATGQTPIRRRAAAALLGRAATIGQLASAMPWAANAAVGGRTGSLRRRTVAFVTGLSATRRLPTFVPHPFSTWFVRREGPRADGEHDVTVLPTCIVEYHAPGLGADLVRVYQRNDIGCRLSGAGCCGAAALHAGSTRRFSAIAARNLRALAAEARLGDIVVIEPSCARAIAEYPRAVRPADRADAELVVSRLITTAEPLLRRQRADPDGFDLGLDGRVPDVVLHIGNDTSHELLELAGGAVERLDDTPGIGGLWSFRADHDRVADELTGRVAAALSERGAHRHGHVVTGDSALANLAVADVIGVAVMHPLELLARASGIDEHRG
ncbi:MAG: (Fe-S)-binding protein [Ilumatobacteraceae bacterium]